MPHAAGETMTRTRQVQLMRAVLFATAGLLALGLVLIPARQWQLTLEFVLETAGNGLFILASSAVGVLIVSRRPDNIIGWIYALVALTLAASEVPGGYASRSLPGSSWAALLPNLLWLAAVPIGVTLLMLLFPTGQLPSPRWRPGVWATVAATIVAVVATALTPGPLEYFPGHQNPLGLADARPVLEVVLQVGSGCWSRASSRLRGRCSFGGVALGASSTSR